MNDWARLIMMMMVMDLMLKRVYYMVMLMSYHLVIMMAHYMQSVYDWDMLKDMITVPLTGIYHIILNISHGSTNHNHHSSLKICFSPWKVFSYLHTSSHLISYEFEILIIITAASAILG